MTTRHGTISDFCLKLTDLGLVLASLGVVIVYRFSPEENPGFVVDYLSERVKVTNAILGALLLLAWYGAFAAQGLYFSHRLSSRATELKEVARAIAICSVALFVAAGIGHWPTINFVTVSGFAVVSFALVVAVRLALRFNLGRLRARGHNVKTVVIVGCGARGQNFSPPRRRRHGLGSHVNGFP